MHMRLLMTVYLMIYLCFCFTAHVSHFYLVSLFGLLMSKYRRHFSCNCNAWSWPRTITGPQRTSAGVGRGKMPKPRETPGGKEDCWLARQPAPKKLFLKDTHCPESQSGTKCGGHLLAHVEQHQAIEGTKICLCFLYLSSCCPCQFGSIHSRSLE